MARLLFGILLGLAGFGAAASERGSLFVPQDPNAVRGAFVIAPRDGIITAREPAAPGPDAGAQPEADPASQAGAVRLLASLFTGRTQHSLFAPASSRRRNTVPGPTRSASLSGGRLGQLLDLVAAAEAGSMGYNAVQLGARVRPSNLATRMTLGQIYDWIAATPGQPHAIGRYQFIPATLRRVAALAGLERTATFSPQVQDRLAHILLEEAGLAAFQSGELGRVAFMRNLAQIWAGLPLPNGRSYYHGYAGNAASMSWARFDAGMADIWPGARE